MIDKFGKKCIVLDAVSKKGGGCFVQIPKACEDMAKIIMIPKSIETYGPKGI